MVSKFIQEVKHNPVHIIEMQQYTDISNIVIYQCINIKTVYLYIQYFMTDAVVVYYGCQLYSSVNI